MTADRRCKPPDTTLDEHVGWQFTVGQLIKRLFNHDRVALHHFAGHVDIALIGCVGNDEPAVRRSLFRRAPHRFIIIPVHGYDLGAVPFYGPPPRRTDFLVNKDHAAEPEYLGAPGDRSAMVSVRRAGHREVGGYIPVITVDEIGSRCRGCSGACRDLPCQQTADSVGAAKGLEAAKAEAPGLVFIPDGPDIQTGCKSGERD